MHSFAEDSPRAIEAMTGRADELEAEVKALRREIEGLRAGRAVAESEGRFRRLTETPRSYVFFYELLPIPRFRYISPTITEVLGYTPDELYADFDLYLKFPHPDDLPILLAARAEGSPEQTVRYRMLRRDGRLIWVVQRSLSILDDAGRVLAVEGIVQDITDSMRVREALCESEERFRLAATHSPDTMLLHDLDLRYIWVSNPPPPFSIEQMLGKTDWELLVAEEARLLTEAKRKALESGVKVGIELSMTLGDRCGYYEAVYEPHRDSEGQVAGVFGYVRDITERKHLEQQLQRAHRLEAAGRVAGQVAHDFNNLLGPLVAYPELIKNGLPENHPAADYCDEMLKAAEQMAKINEDMLTLSRRAIGKMEQVDLNHLVTQVLKQGSPMPGSLAVETELHPRELPVTGSPAQLQRVISNLIGNARDAMDDTGRLLIKTESVCLTDPAGRYNQVQAGEYARLSVRDAGRGIPCEIQDRIFDAFFTTKRSDRRKGSGLGLSIVQNVVEDHHGYVDFESREGAGSVFYVYLPVHRASPGSEPQAEPKVGNERVLVVDDNDLQRKVIGRVLLSLGYRVDAVASGEEALAHLQEHEADLLVLDMVMPGIDGAETYRQAIRMRPGQKAILLSGYAESDRVAEALSLGAGRFIGKPVSPKELARAVRTELDQRA